MLMAVDAQDTSITGSLFWARGKTTTVQEKEEGEVNVTPISYNIDVEVRNRSEKTV